MKRELGPGSVVSVVVPIFNELENLEPFVEEVRQTLQGLSLRGRFELVLCDDGSADGSDERLDELAARHPGEVRVVHLARNFGHAAALSACLEYARGDVVIAMDGDMQDDPAAFRRFIEEWEKGYDVVYAVRTAREEHWFMRVLFWLFYRLMNWIANVDMPLDAGNFGLMDRRVVDSLRRFPEQNVYLPGLRAWVGFRQVGVGVPRRARYSRKTRVGLRGLFNLAGSALFSFSYVPIFAFRVAGVLAIGLAAVLVGWAVMTPAVSGDPPAAWRNLLIAISIFAGINLLGIGILGEYIARIYDEVKARPRYIVSRVSDPEPSATRRSNSESADPDDTKDIGGPR